MLRKDSNNIPLRGLSTKLLIDSMSEERFE